MPASDNQDMQRMQQDAVRRAIEMQQRARPPRPEVQVPDSHGRPQREARPAPGRRGQEAAVRHEHSAPAEAPPAPPAPPPAASPTAGTAGAGAILDLLLKDSEHTLILALIVLLSSEKADSSLIFALLYLAM